MRSRLSSCALKVKISDVSFKKAGRYFLTLVSSEGPCQRRTSVSSSKCPVFGDEYTFPLPFDSDDSTSLAFLVLIKNSEGESTADMPLVESISGMY